MNSETILGGVDPLSDQSFSYISEVRSPVTEGAPLLSPAAGLEMVWPNWPLNVPHPDLLRHL
jgi:hypothetical protein